MERPMWVITAHKRSLGQGNVFTPVCHSVQGARGWLTSAHHRSLDRGGGVLHPRGSASRDLGGRGVCMQGGLPLGICASRGCASGGGGRPSPTGYYGIQAVRILLECILVVYLFCLL